MNCCCENCGWSEIVGSPIMCNYNGHRTWRDECCEAWKQKEEKTNMVEVVRCKDCKHFSFKEYWADIEHGAKILVTDHCPTCDKWADGGCKTDPEGFCFLAERVDA